MKTKLVLAVFFLTVTPAILFWGCGKGTQPSAPAGSGVLNVQLSSNNHSGVQFVGASQNTIYYNVSGAGTSVTGSYGPLSASGVSGTFSFPVSLGSHVTYQTISVEIADTSSGQALAVAAAPLNSGVLSMELGPLNKGCYEVTALPQNNYYNFETNTVSSTAASNDIECLYMGAQGYQLANASGVVGIAYMGTGVMANYLTVPPTNNFEINSSTSKSFVLTGSGASASSYPLALNDVYCCKLHGVGYAWLQVTSVGNGSTTGPSFTFRVNTTLSYCAYEQTTADLASNVLSIFVLPNATPSSGLAVSGPANGAATILYTNYNNATNSWIEGFNMSPTPSPVATAGLELIASTPSYSFGGGLAVMNGGATIVKSFPTPGLVLAFPSSGVPGSAYIGSSASAYPSGYNSPSYYSSYAPSGDWIFPYGMASDSSNDVFGTDIVGTTVCTDNVMGFVGGSYSVPGAGLLTTAGCTAYGIAVTLSGGVTYLYVADTSANKVSLFNSTGSTLGSWSYDKLNSGNLFVSPSGIALNGNGKLFIANMSSSFSVVEWNISNLTSPSYVAEWGASPSSNISSFSFNANVPIGIAVDNAVPPNVFVSDYGNSRTVEFKGQ